MDRRSFLGAVAAVSALGAQGCAPDPPARPEPSASPTPTSTPPSPTPEVTPTPTPTPTPQFVPQHVLPPGPIWGLPDEVGNQLAWTVDDGASAEVVMAYANFAQQTGTRLTFS